jgi:amino acid adenylation domain-containing protein
LSGEADARERLKGLLREEVGRGFDLARGPLFRAQLYRLAPDTHVLMLAMHHIISDGWSMGVLTRELGELYRSFLRQEPVSLPALRVQYRDFARWQRGWLRGEVLERELGHWGGRLAGAPQVLELPTDRARPAVESHRGASYAFRLPRELADRLQELSRREGATLFMTLLAGFALLLARYSNQQDLLIGTPVANRNRAEIEPLIGFFVNTLVLRADTSGEPSVREFLARMREVCLDAYAHQDLPFERLVEELRPARDMSRNPVFQVMFALQNAPQGALELPGLTLSPFVLEHEAVQFDLSLLTREVPEGLAAYFSYATDLFDESTMARMAAHWRVLLEAMVKGPERRVSELPMLADSERHQLLEEWNDTRTDYPESALIHELFEAQAVRTPQAVALEFGEERVSYGELNRRANQLARVLRKKGVGPDVLVGVFAERSFEMVVALLAILKAGGAYVPLDPSYPAERVTHMLEDARVPLVLAQPYLAGRLPAGAAQVLELDPSWATYADEGSDDLDDVGTPGDLAYVIFTSGSTGRPKGAMNEHRGICNRLLWMQEEYGLTADDVVLQKTPFSFDVSVWEFFWPLMSGARLVIARPEGHRDSAYLVRLIQDSGITTLHFVPSMLRVFLEEEGVETCGSLKRVICSGEALPHELQERFFARLPAVELHNLYGPTEAAVDVTYWACRRGDERLTVPIGRPVANTQMYVLDSRMQPVPVGVAGELYIGGVQVGRGYVGRADLTAERFVTDPFSKRPGARLYKTGDLARHLADGAIEYLGRLDYQVKIRGQRIELGEIEAVLDKHPAVVQSVVLAREDSPGDTRLVAYVVARGEAPADLVERLRAHLRVSLPEYMVPSAFVALDKLPLNPNGKVDRRALPAPDGAAYASRGYEAPVGEVETALARIWAEVLKLERVGRHDNFFELGGHSLLAVTLIERMRHTGLNADVQALFNNPTLAAFSASTEDVEIAL